MPSRYRIVTIRDLVPLILVTTTISHRLETTMFNSMKDYAALPLRLVMGGSMAAHGISKFAGGIENTSGFFETLGIPAASLMAPLVAAIETIAGLAIVAGAFVPLMSLLLVFVMLGAMFTVHWANGFFFTNQPPGVEVNLLFIAGFLALMFLGAGKLSVDDMRRGKGDAGSTA